MKISIPLDAVPQGRPRFIHGVVIDPPQSKNFKYTFALIAKASMNDRPAFSGEVAVKLDIYRQASKFKKGVTSKKYGDIDNLAKAILDALNGVCWQDDSQISDLHITKNLADTPRIEIEIFSEREGESR